MDVPPVRRYGLWAAPAPAFVPTSGSDAGMWGSSSDSMWSATTDWCDSVNWSGHREAERERERRMTPDQRAWLQADRQAAELAQDERYAKRAAERAAGSEAARAILAPLHQLG